MAPFTGTRGTSNITSAQIKIDMSRKVMELEPDATPLLVFTKSIDSSATHNPDFDWLEDDSLPRFDRINNGAGYTNAATAVVVDNPAQWQGTDGTSAGNDLAYVSRTGELMRVTAVNVGTSTLTVVRGVGGGAAALVDNDELIWIGTAYQEGDDDRNQKSQNPTKLTNYAQIFRDPVEMTETLRHTDVMHDPHEWERQQNKKSTEHAKSLEYSFLFGRANKDVSGSQPRRTTGGAYNFVTQNTTDVGGAMTEAELFAALRPMFRYGSKRKLVIASPLVIDVIAGYARSRVLISQDETVYGVKITRIRSPHGDLNLATHWLFEGDKLGNEALVLDLSKIAYRYLQNEHGSRDTHIKTNIQPPGRDGRKDEVMSECGLTFGNPKAHGKIYNVTS